MTKITLRKNYATWMEDAKRCDSMEVDYGMWWKLDSHPTLFANQFRVSWIETTGELYAVDLFNLYEYILIDILPTLAAADAAMQGWTEISPDLEALIARLSNGGRA